MKMMYFYGQNKENGFMSNWYPSEFKADGYTYANAEQYMMHRKALLFGDDAVAEKIMHAKTPKEMKALGRKVKPFDPVIWNGRKQLIVYKGLLEKFRQNDDLRKLLLDTSNSVLVEASPWDKVWGIKMSQSNEKCRKTSTWEGENLLGFALMEVRETLKKEEQPKQWDEEVKQ